VSPRRKRKFAMISDGFIKCGLRKRLGVLGRFDHLSFELRREVARSNVLVIVLDFIWIALRAL